MTDLQERVAEAVRLFWAARASQDKKQGSKGGRRDTGARTAVTGGKHLDGFVDLVRDLLVEAGVPNPAVFRKKRGEIPGFFRPQKQWDLLVVHDGRLLASIEFKSHVGPSFSNNYNNRSEEAIGNAVDLRTAYRDGAYRPSPDPWLGYVMLLEDAPASRKPVRPKEPHFQVFEVFRGASYAKRYELLLTRLIRERLYNAASFLLSDRDGGPRGAFTEPSEELSFRNFATSLIAHATAYVKTAR